ncbi:hypothetical protein QNO00_03465 [Arthrobacter sp. zg-Y1219]|uniref:hypothetical protein n=1 Tax=Arthrobacter sp. zg-Y1219 TaxID=3049067 RepID=UPI0024C432AA|nr:hypothetical protein [Arthrobacter sp. zg-Y1219]MDK1359328.1 hypothetical protein [Arthrobacter sp. zg-Y1219]
MTRRRTGHPVPEDSPESLLGAAASALGEGVADAVCVAVGEGDGVAEGVAVGVAEGSGVGDAEGLSDSSSSVIRVTSPVAGSQR